MSSPSPIPLDSFVSAMSQGHPLVFEGMTKGTDLIQGVSIPEPSWWMFSLLRWAVHLPSLARPGKGE